MGEKIRDVSKITLAKNDLIVELNEGYTKDQGRVIHIQNKEFRYLLSVDEFILASSLIMRGKTEFEYIKTKKNYSLPLIEIDDWNISDKSFFTVLNKNRVRYCVLESKPNLITIIVSPADSGAFHRLARKNKFRRMHHPEGEKFGFTFLYQMHPFELYKYNNFFYEVYFEVPCYSLTPKMWMPLDKKVQKWLWDNIELNDDLVDTPDIIKMLYFLVRCIFYYRNVPNKYRSYFERHSDLYESSQMKELLDCVFFKYSNVLISKLKNKEFDNLIDDYFKYSEY